MDCDDCEDQAGVVTLEEGNDALVLLPLNHLRIVSPGIDKGGDSHLADSRENNYLHKPKSTQNHYYSARLQDHEHQKLQQVKDGAYCLASPYSSMFHSLLIKNDQNHSIFINKKGSVILVRTLGFIRC